nr:hypothetical protein [Streptococcus suis]
MTKILREEENIQQLVGTKEFADVQHLLKEEQ